MTSKIGTEPPPAVLLLDFGVGQYLSACVLECLPAEVTQVKVGAQLTSPKARTALGHSEQKIRSIILTSNILADVKYSLLPAQQAYESGRLRQNLRAFTMEHLTTNNVGSDAYVVSWPAKTSTIPVQVELVNSKITFRTDKTYWLVGLSGSLGISLCEWMAQQGARCIVITSRNPKVDERWMNKIKALGVKVEVIAKYVHSNQVSH